MSAARDPARASTGGARERWGPLFWRVLAFAVVYAMAIAGLSMGVGVSERELGGGGLGERAYYALGLFVLGGLDIGTPVGGPAVGRALLWSAYFLAPIITISAILETAIRLIGPMALRARGLSGHVVIGGAGRLALLYVRKLRERDPRRPIVVIDQNATHPHFGELRDLHDAVILVGDIASDGVLGGVRLDRAHRVMLLTGDDFANLDAAAKILSRVPGLAGRMVAHVTDLGFLRETADSTVARDCTVFNAHVFSATHLVHEHLVSRFRSTPHRDLVVLAGFGRFGQTVLHQLQETALGSFDPVVIIDDNATRNARFFEDGPGFADDYDHTVIDGDLRDSEIWTRIAGLVRKNGHDPVIIVGSGDDGMNLRAALRAKKEHPGAYVIVRSLRTSPFMEEAAHEEGVFSFNLGELVEGGMPDAWF